MLATKDHTESYNTSNIVEWNKNGSYNIYFQLSTYHGQLDPLFLDSINPHWMRFTPPEPWEHYTLAIAHICIMCVGLLGNALVIFMFLRCRILRTAANILVINLAISDFFMLAKAPIYIYNSFERGPALGDYACRLYGFLGGLTGTVSIATLTAISLERYYVIVFPLNQHKLGSKKFRAFMMVIFVWVYSLFFAIMPALNIGLSKYTPEGFLTSCSFDYLDKRTSARLFMFAFFIFAWFIPLSIIVYCYINILKVVNLTRAIQSNKMRLRIEHRLALVVMNVIGLWFIAWTPYAGCALIGILGYEAYLTPFGSMLPALFCKASACINPYLYSMTHPQFKKEIIRSLCRRQNFGKTSSTPRTLSVKYLSTRTRRKTSDFEME